MEAGAVQALAGELWNLAICGETWQGPSAPDLSAEQTLPSERVLAMSWSFGSMMRVKLWFWVQPVVKILSSMPASAA